MVTGAVADTQTAVGHRVLAGIGCPALQLGISRSPLCTMGEVVCVAAAKGIVSGFGQACHPA